MKRQRPNAVRKIRLPQRDPYRRKPLKPTAPFSRDRRQLSIDGLWPMPVAAPIKAAPKPKKHYRREVTAEVARRNDANITRAWQELAVASDQLADWGMSTAKTRRIVHDLTRRFELASTLETLAVARFLEGLCYALYDIEDQETGEPETA
jgi:hypothetical protein